MPRSSAALPLGILSVGSEIWDGLLLIGSTVWTKRCSGPLPDPGQQLLLGETLPAVQVVSVVEQRGESVSAALFRPQDADPGVEDVGEWSRLLGLEGWTPQR